MRGQPQDLNKANKNYLIHLKVSEVNQKDDRKIFDKQN